VIVEGVQYSINWKKFKKGTSIFIPCNNPVEAKRTITSILKRLRVRVDTKVSVVDGVKGLHVWRK